jgi:hypothetical protein
MPLRKITNDPILLQALRNVAIHFFAIRLWGGEQAVLPRFATKLSERIGSFQRVF